MATAAVMAVGTAASMYEAHKQGERQKHALSAQEGAQQKQMQMGQQQLGFAKQRYNDWKTHFMPVIEAAQQKAMQAQHPNYDAVTADANHAFDTATGEQQRSLERYGINPADGVMQSMLHRNAVEKAGEITGQRNRARLANKNANYNRMLSFIGRGSGMRSGSESMVNSAYGGLTSALGQSASRNNRNAMSFGQQSANDWTDAAKGAGYLAGSYGKSWGSGS